MVIKKGIEKVTDVAATAQAAITKPVEVLTETLVALRNMADKLIEPFDKMADAGEKFATAWGGQGTGLKGFIAAATEIDGMRAAMERATGASDKYLKMSLNLQAELTQLGISNEEATASVTGLVTGFAEFTNMAPKAQKALVQQAASMTRLGISVAATTQNYELMIKGMGMSQKEAERTTKDIAKLAKAIGVPPKQMAKDFAAAAPTLARYGKSGVKVFKELAVQSKATGMSMTGLLKVAGGFDTFEEAATKAGSLNAMLGGNLINSIDMLTATESQRIDMIRQSMQATGQSWDMLDRFQKKGVAAAVGISDMAEAMRLFGTEQASLDQLKEKADPALVAQQNLTAAMQKGTSIAQRFTAIFDRLGNIIGRTLMPILNRLAIFMTGKKGLGAMADIFKRINEYIEVGLKWWDGLSQKTKGMIADVATAIMKATAFSFALGQMRDIAGPLFDLLTNPWAIIGAGIVLVYTHWNDLTGLWKKAGIYLKSFDQAIGDFFERNENNAFITDFVKPAYEFLKDKIPKALDELSLWFDRTKPKMVEFFTDLKKSAGGWLGKAWEDFRDSKGMFAGGLVATLQRWGQTVMDYFGKAVNLVRGAFGSLLGILAVLSPDITINQANAWQEAEALRAAGVTISARQVFAGTDKWGLDNLDDFDVGALEQARKMGAKATGQKYVRGTAFEAEDSMMNILGFANGGIVPNVGSGVPAMLHPGELVVPADIVSAIGNAASGGGEPMVFNFYQDGSLVRTQEIAREEMYKTFKEKQDGLAISVPSW